MKRNVKTNLTAYMDWPLKAWSHIEKTDYLKRILKDEKIDQYSILGITDQSAVDYWVKKNKREHSYVEIKKVIEVNRHKIILFSYLRYSQGRAWHSRGGYIRQKMALIELKK